MRLDSLILADAAAAYEGKLFVHGGGITRISPPVIPWTHPQLSLVVRLRVENGDERAAHSLTVRIKGPGGALVVPEVTFPIETRGLSAVEGEEAYINYAISVSPLTFAEEGVHEIELDVDGAPARTLPLPVTRVPRA